MLWIDYIFFSIILFTTVFGWIRCFSKEFSALLSWLVGLYAGIKFNHYVEPYFYELTENERHTTLLAFATIFVSIMLVMYFSSKVVSKCISITGLGIFDRILGAALGVVKGIVISIVLVLFINLFQLLPAHTLKRSYVIPKAKLVSLDLTGKFEPEIKKVRRFLYKL